MYSKAKHSKLIYEPFRMTRASLKRQLKDQPYNDTSGVWHHDARNCLLMAFYCQRETQAEIKIFNLLMHSDYIQTNTDRPKDAEIIFGNCDCEKVFCEQGSCRSRWGKSRIEWLWELEQRQHQQSWQKSYSHRQLSRRRSLPPSAIILNKATKPRHKNTGCWTWLRHSCGYVSDTESFDVPFSRSSISL